MEVLQLTLFSVCLSLLHSSHGIIWGILNVWLLQVHCVKLNEKKVWHSKVWHSFDSTISAGVGAPVGKSRGKQTWGGETKRKCRTHTKASEWEGFITWKRLFRGGTACSMWVENMIFLLVSGSWKHFELILGFLFMQWTKAPEARSQSKQQWTAYFYRAKNVIWNKTHRARLPSRSLILQDCITGLKMPWNEVRKQQERVKNIFLSFCLHSGSPF